MKHNLAADVQPVSLDIRSIHYRRRIFVKFITEAQDSIVKCSPYFYNSLFVFFFIEVVFETSGSAENFRFKTV